MLIPIGFFGAGGAAGAYELISTAYGTGSSGTITFSSIPSTYKHLQIRYTAKNSTTGTTILLTANSDSATNYARHFMRGTGSVIQSAASSSVTSITLNNAMASSTTANAFGSGYIDVLDYASTSKNKTIKTLHGDSSDVTFIYSASGLWLNTAAISTISLTANTGNFTTTSRFSLYGIKG